MWPTFVSFISIHLPGPKLGWNYSCNPFAIYFYQLCTSGSWCLCLFVLIAQALSDIWWSPLMNSNFKVFLQTQNQFEFWASIKPFYHIKVLGFEKLQYSMTSMLYTLLQTETGFILGLNCMVHLFSYFIPIHFRLNMMLSPSWYPHGEF